MENTQPKSPSQSAVETRYLLMPQHANPYGTAFGGVVMGWIDQVASMAARRHCGREVVTASIDSISFRNPAYVGDQILLKASVNYVGRTSMEVGVQVTRESPETGDKLITTTAHLTFVALDKNKKPTSVPPLEPETEVEKRRYESAQLRVQTRKRLIQELREINSGTGP